MRKYMVEFLRKSVSRVIKNAQGNSIRITNSINLLLLCKVLGSLGMLTLINQPLCAVHL